MIRMTLLVTVTAMCVILSCAHLRAVGFTTTYLTFSMWDASCFEQFLLLALTESKIHGETDVTNPTLNLD